MTNPDAVNWRDIGPTSSAVYVAEFKRLNAVDLLPHAQEMHKAAGPHSALALAHMFAENKYSTTGIMIQPEHNNPLALRPGPGIQVDYGLIPGPFLSFTTPVDCVREWRRRIEDPAYKADQFAGGAYASTTTLKEYVYRYNPPGDTHPVTGETNNSDKYMQTLLTMMRAYQTAEGVLEERPAMRRIKITQAMIRAGASNRPGSKLNAGNKRFLVHETANTNDGADAAMHARFVQNGGGDSNVSFHFAVDEKGAYQMLPLDEVGYHASDGCDLRSVDWGCFGSIAIETCVHNNNAYKVKTRENLVILMAMVIAGDPQINYGSSKPSEFSHERINIHQQSAYDRKECPRYMIREGFVPKLPGLVKAELAGVPASIPVTPTPAPVPSLVYPGGMDEGIAALLFGQVIDGGTKRYDFDPGGIVSKLWLERGKQTGAFPRIIHVQTFDVRTYFQFSDGLVLMYTPKDGLVTIGG